MNILSLLPSWLMEATLRGSAGILLVWILAPLARRWIGARAAHLLWLMALVPLLVPALPDSPISFASAPAVQPPQMESRFAGAQIIVSVDDAPVERTIAPPTRVKPASFAWTEWLLPAWALGAFLVGALAVVRAIRAALLVRRAPEISGHAVVAAALRSMPVSGGRVRIRETRELRSPAVCGLLRPTILLPVHWWQQLSEEEFRCVLLHEIGHIRRGDLLWRWAFLIARAVHWFNPLVWLAERSARVDQELACDEWVLAQTGAPDGETYGEVLLKASTLLGVARFSSPVHATMAESRLGLTRRIRHLGDIRPHGWLAMGAALLVAAVAVLFIAPPQSQAQEQPAPASPSPLPAARSLRATCPGERVAGRAPREPRNLPFVPAVEISSKFVEISETEMTELTQGASTPPDPSAAPTVPVTGEITVDRIDALLFGSQSSRAPESITGVFTDPQFEVVVRALNQRRGVDLLSAPRVTTKPGQRAVIEIIREFRYPTEFGQQGPPGYLWPKAFETRNTGVTLEVLPTIAPDGTIELELSPQVVEFLGFVNFRAGRPARPAESKDAMNDLLERVDSAKVINQPIFRTRKITTTVLLKSGETALVGGMGRSDEEVPDAKLAERINKPSYNFNGEAGKKVVPRSLYIFITARLVDSTGAATPAPAADAKAREPRKTVIVQSDKPTAPTTPVAGPPLKGLPVPGKPGFVMSPYSPDAGYVDVRGFPPGTSVKCPYTGESISSAVRGLHWRDSQASASDANPEKRRDKNSEPLPAEALGR